MSTPNKNLEQFIVLQKEFTPKDNRPRVELFDSVETTKDSTHGSKYVCIYSIRLDEGKFRFRDTYPIQLYYFVNKDRLKPEMQINPNVASEYNNGATYFYYLKPELINDVIKNSRPDKIDVLPEDSQEKHFRYTLYKNTQIQNPNTQFERKSNLESKERQEFRNQSFDDSAFQRDIERAIQESLTASSTSGSNTAGTTAPTQKTAATNPLSSTKTQSFGLAPQSSTEEDRQLKQALEESLKDNIRNAPTEINLEPKKADQKHISEGKLQKDKASPTPSLDLSVTFDSINSAYLPITNTKTTPTDQEIKLEKDIRKDDFFNETLKYESVEDFIDLINSGIVAGPFQKNSTNSYEPWQQSPYYLRPVNNPQYKGVYSLGFLFYEPEEKPPYYKLGFQEILFKPTEQGFAIYEHSNKISPLTGGPYTPTNVTYSSLEKMIQGEHNLSFSQELQNEIITFYDLKKLNLTIEDYIAMQNDSKSPGPFKPKG